jgi:hypothetical protein
MAKPDAAHAKLPDAKPDSASDAKDDLKTLPLPEVEKRLSASPDGLTQAEATKRLAKYGPNEIEEKKTNALLKFLKYFWGPIPWMIEVAVILSGVVQHWPDFFIILILLFANAIIGFWEERQAGNAIEALKAKLAIKSRVKRDGKWVTPPAKDLVPGDVIRLRLGDIVPADARLLDGDELSVDQSALTGESLPASKKSGDAIFSGSIVRRGEISALVYATGGKTYFGRTAELVQSAVTVSHFQQAVLRIGNYLIILAVALVSVIIGVGIYRGEPVLGEAALRGKRAHERAVLKLRHQPGRQAAGQVDTAGGHDLQGQIASFGAPDVDHDPKRPGGERVGVGIVQRRPQNGRRAVAGGVQHHTERPALGGRVAGTHVIVDVRQAGAGADAFIRRVPEALGQERPQARLDLIGRGEISVAAFGGTGDIVMPAPDQESFAEPGAGGQHRNRGVRHGLAGIDLGRVSGLQMRHRVSDRFEVVKQGDVVQAEIAAQRRLLQVPRQVRQVRTTLDDRACHVEARGGGPFAAAGQECLDDRLQSLEVGAVELLLGHELPRPGVRRDESQPGRGRADVAREQHQAASPSRIDCSSRARFAVTLG